MTREAARGAEPRRTDRGKAAWEDGEIRYLTEAAGRIDAWLWQHRDQSVDTSVDNVPFLGRGGATTDSSPPSSRGNRRELNPIEIQRVTRGLQHLSVGSTESLGPSWTGSQDRMSAKLPHFRTPVFHGTEGENYLRFFEEMEGLSRLMQWSDNEHLQIVKLGLKDGAATWLKAKADADQDTVDKVKAIIKEAFGDKRPSWQKHRDLSNLQQEKGQSVRAFALKIKEYANSEDPNDAHLLAVFIAGVPRHIGIELAKSELATLDQAVAQAVRIESVDKRSSERKAGLMSMEMDADKGESHASHGKGQMREFEGMMENMFAEYQNHGDGYTGYGGGYGNGGGQRGGNRGGRGRYTNQGNYNNQAQGGTPPGGVLTNEEYKQRSLRRAQEYRKQRRIWRGEHGPEADNSEAARYCIIHDSRTHATADCMLLREDHPASQAQGATGNVRAKQVTFAPNSINQGN